jgi:hypothetical protein
MYEGGQEALVFKIPEQKSGNVVLFPSSTEPLLSFFLCRREYPPHYGRRGGWESHASRIRLRESAHFPPGVAEVAEIPIYLLPTDCNINKAACECRHCRVTQGAPRGGSAATLALPSFGGGVFMLVLSWFEEWWASAQM